MRRYLPYSLIGLTLLLLGLCLVMPMLIRMPDLHIPPRRYPVPNAYDRYKRLGDAAYRLPRSDPKLQAWLDYPYPNPKLNSASEYAYLQRAFGHLLKEYRRHLDQPSVVVLEYDLNYAFPELVGFRYMARAEQLLMDYELRHGQTAAALERFDSMTRFSQQIRKEGSLIHFLVGVAITNLVGEPLAQHLATLDPAALERLVGICRRYERERVPFVGGLRVERYFWLSVFQQLYDGTLRIDEDTFGSKPPLSIRVPFIRKLVYPAALKGYDDYMKQVIAETQKPPWRRHPVNPPKSWSARLFVDMLSSEPKQAWHNEAMEMAQIRLLGCAAAIRLHQLRTGRYPARLEELNLGTMAIDPFTGQMFRYKTDPRKGFLLYSVGADRQDDGGWRAPVGQTSRGDLSLIPYRPRRSATSSSQAAPLGEPAWLR
jgi:hypothetical protein